MRKFHYYITAYMCENPDVKIDVIELNKKDYDKNILAVECFVRSSSYFNESGDYILEFYDVYHKGFVLVFIKSLS